jgi:DNA-binding NtrC family response regulator
MGAHGGNISAASRAVKMSRNHLAELLSRYDVRTGA